MIDTDHRLGSAIRRSEMEISQNYLVSQTVKKLASLYSQLSLRLTNSQLLTTNIFLVFYLFLAY
jgi:hypothetical protein